MLLQRSKAAGKQRAGTRDKDALGRSDSSSLGLKPTAGLDGADLWVMLLVAALHRRMGGHHPRG